MAESNTFLSAFLNSSRLMLPFGHIIGDPDYGFSVIERGLSIWSTPPEGALLSTTLVWMEFAVDGDYRQRHVCMHSNGGCAILPTPLAQTPHGHLTAFCRFPLIITLVLFIFTFMPLFSKLSFHLLSLLVRSSSVSAITATSLTYNNSHGKLTLHSLDKAHMTITNSKGLNAEPWLAQNSYCYNKLFLQLFLHLCT